MRQSDKGRHGGRLVFAFCGAFAVVHAAGVPTARADERSVGLWLEPCVTADASEVRRIVAIELNGQPVVIASRRDAAYEPMVLVSCDGKAARLRLRDGAGARSVRRVDLTTLAGRERLLALAIVELVAPGHAEDPARLSAEREVAPRPGTGAWSVSPFGMARRLGGPQRLSVGAGLALDYHLPFSGTLSADALVERSKAYSALGILDADLASFGLAASLDRVLGAARLGVGVGGRCGLASLRGRPGQATGARGHTRAAVWGGPFVVGRLDVFSPALSRDGGTRLRLSLALEIGYAARPIHGLAGEETAIALEGVWAALSARPGLAF